ncbi:Por secretion system C-terminal sorting domain-containing protein [Lishizhenia tianjinensis]|uniref:Por secretion system C-terminal sorting domain-containing protein n=1 Tax=Lishizhenia tianjinensis TaxID=477690 RepID=A0A1I6ZP86_9FLAO|nr:kelch repeat-containing protein [Lishizhenia tianjinensis]SFT64523.1 Por secretion system C-terminal sorting domain-containing protein [Lishizhenia tianjinensis]
MKLLCYFILILPLVVCAQQWEALPNFPGDARDDAVAFALQGKGYCVTGKSDNGGSTNTLYSYDPTTEKWEQKSSFPGVDRQYTAVFTIANKAYLIGGYSLDGDALKDVWQYDGELDTWTQKQDFPDSARWSTVAFSSGEYGYFGLGASFSGLKKDFWKYHPKTDTWTKLKDFPGEARRDAIGVALQGKAIVGLGLKGFDAANHFEDLYSFDVFSEEWTAMDNFPGGKLSYAFADKIDTKLIIGGGMKGDQDFQSKVYQYELLTNSWSALDTLLADPMRGSSHFVINREFYLCTGLTGTFTRSKIFHRLSFSEAQITLYPNPAQDRVFLSTTNTATSLLVRLYNTQGELVLEKNTIDSYITLPPLKAGVYFCHLLENEGLIHSQKLVIQ